MKKFMKKVMLLVGVVVAVSAGAGLYVAFATPSFVQDTFSDETKVGKGTEKVEIDTALGQVSLAECYTANTGWTFHATTNVRDIALGTADTVTKDIYCDGTAGVDAEVCILVTSEHIPDPVVCVATDANVYGNILWAVEDNGSAVWGPAEGISGGDVGGYHSAELRAGNGNTLVGNLAWLERYYQSSAGTYLAMDACKARGDSWRLPTIMELDSIRDQGIGSAPYSRLPGIASTNYWSSTESSATNAYYLTFNHGYIVSSDKSSSRPVRCVSGQ